MAYVIDIAIKFVKDEIRLTDDGVKKLIKGLSIFRRTVPVIWIKNETSSQATINACLGEERKEEIFLFNQQKISKGDIIIKNGEKIVVEEVTFKPKTEEEKILIGSHSLQVLN